MRTACAAVLMCLALAACGGPSQQTFAPDSAVAAARQAHTGPARVTLYVVRSTDTGFGAHAGLMIAGSERVIFDPAGTFALAAAPERNDVHFGVTDRIEAVYIDYHARETYDVEIREVDVTRAEADRLIAAARNYGAVPKAQCALSITRILNTEARFSTLPVTYFPNTAAAAFDALPGVTTRRVTDDDADDNHGVLIEANR